MPALNNDWGATTPESSSLARAALTEWLAVLGRLARPLGRYGPAPAGCVRPRPAGGRQVPVYVRVGAGCTRQGLIPSRLETRAVTRGGANSTGAPTPDRTT